MNNVGALNLEVGPRSSSVNQTRVRLRWTNRLTETVRLQRSIS